MVALVYGGFFDGNLDGEMLPLGVGLAAAVRVRYLKRLSLHCELDGVYWVRRGCGATTYDIEVMAKVS